MKARENPFAVDRVQTIRYRPLDATLGEILARLRELSYRGAIVGPDGSGKTTLLEDLQRALEAEGLATRMVFVNDTSPLPAPACRRLLSELDRDEIVLLDGADSVPRSCWSLLKRRTVLHAAGLVITSHRPGMLPTLIECTTSLELLREIVADLQPFNRPVPPDLLASLYIRYHGNLRDCLRALYDLHAGV